MTALYAPIWVVPRSYPAQWWVWKAHIDTGSPVTIAGSRLAHDLLSQHIKQMGRPPQYERFNSATDHPLTVAPVDALVRVPDGLGAGLVVALGLVGWAGDGFGDALGEGCAVVGADAVGVAGPAG